MRHVQPRRGDRHGRQRFRNWAGHVHAHPHTFSRPASAEELSGIVTAAAAAGDRLRVVGAGHSFTPVAAGDDVMVNLDGLSGIIAVDEERKRVRFAAGTRLRDIPALLAPYGLALENQGDVNPQAWQARSRRARTAPESASPGSPGPSPG